MDEPLTGWVALAGGLAESRRASVTLLALALVAVALDLVAEALAVFVAFARGAFDGEDTCGPRGSAEAAESPDPPPLGAESGPPGESSIAPMVSVGSARGKRRGGDGD